MSSVPWSWVLAIYNVVVAVLSGMVFSELENTTAKTVKFWNNIVFMIAVGLFGLMVGSVIGQSACTAHKGRDWGESTALVILVLLAIAVEVFLSFMVASAEFAMLPQSARTNILTMLVLNSLGLALGAYFTVEGLINTSRKEGGRGEVHRRPSKTIELQNL